jgi:hypothetical protein
VTLFKRDLWKPEEQIPTLAEALRETVLRRQEKPVEA